MSAEVETMFSVRETPWDGLGTVVSDATNSDEAIKLAGLDWLVEKRALADTVTGEVIKEFMATVRTSDNRVLGAVSPNRYQIVQNIEAFKFTDRIVGGDVKYETAGSLYSGKKVWLQAKLPETTIVGDTYVPYLVFTNSHDGSGAVRVAITPIRVVCNNTLNLALDHAARSWACNHRGNISENLHEASKTLGLTNKYMAELERVMTEAKEIKVDEVVLNRFVGYLLPINKDDTKRKADHIKEMRDDIIFRWKNAPDLSETAKDGYRFLNAVSDFGVHTAIHKDTPTFKENLFGKVITGNGLYIDKAYDILRKAA